MLSQTHRPNTAARAPRVRITATHGAYRKFTNVTSLTPQLSSK